MKIAFFELEDWEEVIIKKSLPEADLFFLNEKIVPELSPARADFDIISIFVDSQINADVLNWFPNLKFITTRSTGYDHIDLEACRKRGISVAYVPGYGDNTVAEFAFGLILNLTRKIYQAIDQIKETESFTLTELRGTDLKGKTIGVVGTGRIGKEAIKIAAGFGMKIIAYDPYPDLNFVKQFGFRYVDLETLLRASDVISIHCPLNAQTRHLINSQNINLIKPGAYLVNTARGGVVATDALVLAIKKGILAGAGLDVLEEEGETKDELALLSRTKVREEELRTVIANHVLMKHKNVLITPHTAFNSKEALERILETTISNIKGFLAKKPINLIS